MMALLWTKRLSVGNAMFDSEHKKLIGVINQIEYAIKTKDYSALLRELKLLMHHLHAHEMKEEQFSQMASLSFDQHKLAHQHLQTERSEEHTSELQSPKDLVCRLLLEKKK